MRRTTRVLMGAMLLCSVPTTALAADGELPAALSTISGLVALALAAVLLVVVVRLRRVADGSMIAESVHFVVAAVLCLGASVLVGLLGRAFADISAEFARYAADLLVIVSMVLFGVYFVRVRAALTRYLKGSEELLSKMQAADDDWDASPGDEG